MLERTTACFASVALAFIGASAATRTADVGQALPSVRPEIAAPVEPGLGIAAQVPAESAERLDERASKPGGADDHASTPPDGDGRKSGNERDEGEDRVPSSKLTVGSFDRVERPHRVPTPRAPCLRLPHKLSGVEPHDIPFISCWPADQALAARVRTTPLLLLRGAVESHAPPSC